MKSQYFKTTIQIEDEQLDIHVLEVHGRIEYFTDTHHGEDADRNRAYVETYVDEVDIIEVFEDGKEVVVDELTALIIKSKVEDKFFDGSI